MTKLHLSLNVSDMEGAVTFYQAFLGAPPHKRRPGYANFDLDDPPLKLALNEASGPQRRGALNHLGFLVESLEQVLAVKERLQAAGLATFDEMDTTCCYAKQDKIWVHDPDGNAWEVYALTDDLLDDHEHDHLGRELTADGAVPLPGEFILLGATESGSKKSPPTCCG
jgi:catechol 2,3-dioxygenase-like lactoylglutathione lyase family enzyme